MWVIAYDSRNLKAWVSKKGQVTFEERNARVFASEKIALAEMVRLEIVGGKWKPVEQEEKSK